MRYKPDHKIETYRKIVKDAARRVRAEGMNGAAVGAVMRDTGLTHGRFYKHFGGKEDLLEESLQQAFREIEDTLVRAAEKAPRGEAWKAIVKTYLQSEMCDHPERACPIAALVPELARADERIRPQIVGEARELQKPNGTVHAWPENRRQRTRFLCVFFNHGRGNPNCPHAAVPCRAGESVGKR